ncbi:3 exoribonuclease family protein [Apiospora arundinis]|uniref:3 exoribonuclease family protein n=1 Tax=Apiospora arundinis TaxID=335852 RepID=A0ABR2I4K8_9PEZI
MRRPSAGSKGSRASGFKSGPTAVSSAKHPSGAESDPVAALAVNISDLTIDVPIENAPKPKRKVIIPFRFMELPSELRERVYAYHFDNFGEVLDLDNENYKRYHKRLGILRTCRLVYREASYIFYTTHTVRLFPIYGKFFKAKKPLLARMTPNQRSMINTLELRLGPGWNRPPRGWVVNEGLGLKDCTSARRVKVFVECDPSNEMFKGFRHSDGFYERFSRELLGAVLDDLPRCQTVEFDANPSVKKNGAMMKALLEVTTAKECHLAWGPEKGWDDGEEKEDEVKIISYGEIGSRLAMNAHVLIDTTHSQEHGTSVLVVA